MPALLALLTALGQLPAPTLATPGEEVQVSSDTGEVDRELVRAQGSVVLKSGGLLMLADELEYSRQTRQGSAAGRLLFVDGNVVMRARAGTFSLAGDDALALTDAELWQKAPAAAQALLALRDVAQARGAGKNILLLKADFLERIAKGRYIARKMRMTSCDCAEDVSPDWSLWAYKADIEPGERAILISPTIFVKQVPVFWLPVLYVPLSSRRTGFLFPRPNYTTQNGFQIDEPFFLTLGESYDLTLTAGYRFGEPPGLVNPKDTPLLVYTRAGTQGPRGSVEFRYAPVEETWGRLFVAALYDLHRDPNAADRVPTLRPERGWRGELSWRHTSDLDHGFAVRSDVNLLSDANYLNDEAIDVMRDIVPYVRSSAWAGWRGGNLAVDLATGWYQDRSAAFPTPEAWFVGGNAPVSLQRPLSFFASVPRVRLLGPLRAGVELSGTNYQPLSLFAGPIPPNELTLTRLDIAPALSLPLAAGPVNVELYARGRGDLAIYDGASLPEQRILHGRALVGGWAGTELSRTFFDGGWQHTIEPRLEVRAASPRFGDGLVLDPTAFVAPLDEFDERAEGYVQGVAAISSRLLKKGRGSLARLEVGQDLDLLKGQAADSFASLDITPRYVTFSASGRWDWGPKQKASSGDKTEMRGLSAASVGLRLYDDRGDSLYLTYDRLLGGGTDRTRAALDALFGPRSDATDLLNQLAVTVAVVPYKGIGLRYSASMNPSLKDDKEKLLPFDQLFLQHSAGLSLTTDADCWHLDLSLTYVPSSDRFVFGFLLDLKNLGSFGRTQGNF